MENYYSFIKFLTSNTPLSTLQTGNNYYAWVRTARPSTNNRGIYIYRLESNGATTLISDLKKASVGDQWQWVKMNKKGQATNYIFTKADFGSGLVVKGDGLNTGAVYVDKILITDDVSFDPNI